LLETEREKLREKQHNVQTKQEDKSIDKPCTTLDIDMPRKANSEEKCEYVDKEKDRERQEIQISDGGLSK